VVIVCRDLGAILELELAGSGGVWNVVIVCRVLGAILELELAGETFI
jgi:hypothetical protein